MSTGFPPRVRRLVMDRCDGICEKCARAEATQLHHRRPRGRGGSHDPATNLADNALALCFDCHRFVEENRDLSRRLGWLVPASVSLPNTVPVLLKYGDVHLDEWGGYTLVEHMKEETA